MVRANQSAGMEEINNVTLPGVRRTIRKVVKLDITIN
jgi:hypothetical protein